MLYHGYEVNVRSQQTGSLTTLSLNVVKHFRKHSSIFYFFCIVPKKGKNEIILDNVTL